jgi:hypothetical protein
VQPDVLFNQRFQKHVSARGKGASFEQELSQTARAVGYPAVEAVQQGFAVDEAVLQR